MIATYFICFESLDERDRFLVEAKRQTLAEYQTGEFLPDVIATGVDDYDLIKIQALAPKARIIRDFGHALTEEKE